MAASAPTPTLKVASFQAGPWVLRVHTLHALWVSRAETGRWPSFSWEDGQGPSHLTSSAVVPSPSQACMPLLGQPSSETQVTQTDYFQCAFSCSRTRGSFLTLPSTPTALGLVPTCPGAQSSMSRSCLSGVRAQAPAVPLVTSVPCSVALASSLLHTLDRGTALGPLVVPGRGKEDVGFAGR